MKLQGVWGGGRTLHSQPIGSLSNRFASLSYHLFSQKTRYGLNFYLSIIGQGVCVCVCVN